MAMPPPPGSPPPPCAFFLLVGLGDPAQPPPPEGGAARPRLHGRGFEGPTMVVLLGMEEVVEAIAHVYGDALAAVGVANGPPIGGGGAKASRPVG